MSDLIDRAEQAEQNQRSDAIAAIQLKNQVQGCSLSHCEDCGIEIPDARRNAIKGVRRCINCQLDFEFYEKTRETK